MDKQFYCGIDGGATVSKLVLINGDGEILSSVEGPATNFWLSDLYDVYSRLFEMIENAKAKAKLPKETVLDGLGMCLSGCEDEEKNNEFKEKFLNKYPNLTKSCIIASDTMGPLYTASGEGGLVLIAGTGSNSLLINKDGTTGRCGGWGHLIGDEGSAMWLSLKAVKTILDDEDNLEKCPFSTARVKELMLEYFEIEDKFGILKHCYSEFNKTYFAGLCAKLAEAASTEGDPLCCHLFKEVGKALAKMVIALKPSAHKELLETKVGLPIICVGSVFKSWHLLETGFVETIGDHYDSYTLMTLKCCASIGAAFLGAKASGYKLPIDHSKNVSILYNHQKK